MSIFQAQMTKQCWSMRCGEPHPISSKFLHVQSLKSCMPLLHLVMKHRHDNFWRRLTAAGSYIHGSERFDVSSSHLLRNGKQFSVSPENLIFIWQSFVLVTRVNRINSCFVANWFEHASSGFLLKTTSKLDYRRWTPTKAAFGKRHRYVLCFNNSANGLKISSLS